MAPRQARKSLPAKLRHSDSELEEESSQDFDQQAEQIKSKAEGLIATADGQRQRLMRATDAEHAKRFKGLNEKIDVLFEGRKYRVIKSQQLLWDRLEALNKKRANIEQLILASMKNMEHQTKEITDQLDTVLHERMKDIFATPSQVEQEREDDEEEMEQ